LKSLKIELAKYAVPSADVTSVIVTGRAMTAAPILIVPRRSEPKLPYQNVPSLAVIERAITALPRLNMTYHTSTRAA